MSTRSLRAKFIFDMAGNMRRQAGRFGDAFGRLGNRGERELGRVGRAADAANRKLNHGLGRGLQAATAGLVIGAGLAIRNVAQIEERLERAGNSAEKSTEEMREFRKELATIAKQPDIRLDPTEILAAVEEFVTATGDFDLADKIKREMALAIQATGVAGEQMGKLAATMFQKFDFKSPKEFIEAFDLLARQGQAGAIELSDLASIGPKSFSAFARNGASGLDGLGQAGAMLQFFKRGTDSPEETATIFENVITDLYDPTKRAKLRKAGVRLDDAEGNPLGPFDLMKKLIVSARGDDELLQQVFTATSFRGVGGLAKIFRETGGFGDLDDLSAIRGDGSKIRGDSARMADTANASFSNFRTNVEDTVQEHLLEPLSRLADAANALMDEGIELTFDDVARLALAGIGAIGVAKAGLWTLRGGAPRKTRTPGGASPADLPGMAGATPVFVTNWPAGMMDAGGAKRSDEKSATRRGRKTGRLGALTGALGTLGTMAVPAAPIAGVGLGVGAAGAWARQQWHDLDKPELPPGGWYALDPDGELHSVRQDSVRQGEAKGHAHGSVDVKPILPLSLGRLSEIDSADLQPPPVPTPSSQGFASTRLDQLLAAEEASMARERPHRAPDQEPTTPSAASTRLEQLLAAEEASRARNTDAILPKRVLPSIVETHGPAAAVAASSAASDRERADLIRQMVQFIGVQNDTVDEIAAQGRANVVAIKSLERKVGAQRAVAMGPRADTGRMMVGPQ